ncbi:DUF3575 domain-containing protein [uncultured Croceitalea sp.]|uniref:DUF3575 domain-containing protein n=1 Tax=uncultured Croceitalea sp. TaxID=1798908 RepID=UPI003305D970
MKKSFLLVIVSLQFFTTQAQQKNRAAVDQAYKKNEIKFNVLRSLSGAFEVVYERSLNKRSSLGASVFVPYNQGKVTEDIDVNYFITSYYRRYFGKKYGSGFFLEGFGMLTSIDGKQLMDENGNLTPNEGPDVIDFAPGIGLGSKWVTKSGFVFEGNLGLGRLLFNAEKTDHDSVYRLGLSVGYRF